MDARRRRHAAIDEGIPQRQHSASHPPHREGAERMVLEQDIRARTEKALARHERRKHEESAGQCSADDIDGAKGGSSKRANHSGRGDNAHRPARAPTGFTPPP